MKSECVSIKTYNQFIDAKSLSIFEKLCEYIADSLCIADGSESIEEIDKYIGDDGYVYEVCFEDTYDQTDIIDEGKYQYYKEYYVITRVKQGEENSRKTRSMLNLFVVADVQRSGSYFSNYYTTYDSLKLVMAEKVLIPQIIIPEHEEIHETIL